MHNGFRKFQKTSFFIPKATDLTIIKIGPCITQCNTMSTKEILYDII